MTTFRDARVAMIEAEGQETESTSLILETNELASRIYKGVGQQIDSGMGVEDQVSRANLNWIVETSDIQYGEKYKHTSGYRKALYRTDNGELLDIVGKNWKPFQNIQIVATFNLFCKNNGLEIEQLGSLDNGRCIFATAPLNESFALADNDIVTGKLLLTNYHKNGHGLRIDLMAVRLVCGNGMTMPVRIGGKIISHVGEYSETTIAKVLDASRNNFVEYQKQSESLSKVPVSVSEATLLLIKAFGVPGEPVENQPRTVQTCLKLFQGQAQGSDLLSAYGTAWGLLNSITEYFGHHSIQRGGTETHINSLWLGAKARKQNNFMEQLIKVYNR